MSTAERGPARRWLRAVAAHLAAPPRPRHECECMCAATTATTAPGLRCVPLSPVFGARVFGLDTGRPAGEADAEAVRRLLMVQKLLVIPGSNKLDVSQVAAFGRSLGLGPEKKFASLDDSLDYMTTFEDEPSVMLLDHGPTTTVADINIWHQDHSYRAVPTRYELSCMAMRRCNRFR
eukprot:SAG22_NODE_1510_length_4262_cov_37.593082_3_plen_177_part_00